MKLNKVISPSGQVYLNNYMFRNDMKSVIMTDLKLNTQYALRMSVVQVCT